MSPKIYPSGATLDLLRKKWNRRPRRLLVRQAPPPVVPRAEAPAGLRQPRAAVPLIRTVSRCTRTNLSASESGGETTAPQTLTHSIKHLTNLEAPGVRRLQRRFSVRQFRVASAALALSALLLTSCRTTLTLPPVNLSEPGWTLRQGQALWRSKRDAPEIAGE